MRSTARALIDEEFAADTTVADALPATGVALRQVWRGNPGGPVAIAIAVPARDDAARIGACIRALAVASGGRGDVGVVVFVNNATDATVEQAVVAARTSGCRALVVAADTAPALANSGWARRIALDLCCGWLGGDGVLMTTDADGRVAPRLRRSASRVRRGAPRL